jgi:recombination protein RecA
MLSPEASSARHEALAGLRTVLHAQHREASDAAFVRGEQLIPTGFPEFDGALGGGFPRGIIATLEGPPSSGRCTFTARLLATATARGLGALIQTSETGTLYPPALETAGIALDRLLVIAAREPTAVARAADIVLRSGAFGVVAIPVVALPAVGWTRLAGLAHRANALLVAVGTEASSELRYFASLRVRLRLARVRWAGSGGIFATLAGYDVRADVIKSKRSAPGKSACVPCTTFEMQGPSLTGVRERELALHDARIRAASGRY